MANTRELRRRIKSVKNTAQITKAMQMVAATKMRRAQNQAISGRPYSETLSFVLNQIQQKGLEVSSPLTGENGSSKKAVLFITSDKGLCGALNTNLFRLIQASDTLGASTIFFTIGKKGRDFVVRSNRNLEGDFENLETVAFNQAVSIRKILTEGFKEGLFGEVYIVYPHFVSTLRQEPNLVKILPINNGVILNGVKDLTTSREIAKSPSASRNDSVGESEFIFEPNVTQILDYALLHHIDTQIYQAILETKASEHSARMMAMQSATDNAKDLVADLQLTYNQARQGAITTELLEITSAATALGS